MNLIHPILLPFYCLILGAFFEFILTRTLSAKGKGWLALAASLGALVSVIALIPTTMSGQAAEIHLMPWDGPFSLVYHVDGLSILFAFMAAFIGSAVLLYSIEYMEHETGTTRFYSLVLLFIAGFIHLVYSADLIAMYVSWEIIGLCSFFLVGFWYQKQEAVDGARKVIVMTHLAGYGLLAGILILFARTGTTLWTDPAMHEALSSGVFILILIAAAAKSVQFPLHTWIPDAMAAPTPVSALLHAACYVKAGVYLVARLHSMGTWPGSWSTIVIWMGVVTLVVGALFALIQTDLKRLLAFSTVSQIGYMMLGIGLGTPLGIAAGLLHCLNHGLFKGGLFLGAGSVQHATHTRDMNLLGGLVKKMPQTTLFWLINAGSIAGIPLMSGFVSKWLLYNAGLEAGQYLPVMIAWLVSVITIFYFLKATTISFFGETTPIVEKVHEVGLPMRLGMGILAAGSLILGLAPQIAIQTLINPILVSLQLEPVSGISWLGITIASGSWWTSLGLLMAIAASGVGFITYRLARSTKQNIKPQNSSIGNRVFTGGEPLSDSGRLPVSDFTAIIKNGLSPFYTWFDVDRYYLVIWKKIRQLGMQTEVFSRWMERKSLIILPLVFIGLLLAGVLAFSEVSSGLAVDTVTISGIWFIGLGLSSLGLMIAGWFSKQSHQYLHWLIISCCLVMIGLLQQDALLRLICLETSSLFVAWVVWKSSKDKKAAYPFILAFLFSAACLFGAHFTGPSRLGIGLYFAGFALKIALIPAYLWLSATADNVSVSVIGLITSVIDMAAFAELWLLRQSEPEIFATSDSWLVLAVLSALCGAILMLGQRDLKRFLAFSSIEDMGYLVAGVTLAGQWGVEGALIGAFSHILAKGLLFISLTLPENSGSLKLDRHGLARVYPMSAIGFSIGSLAMLGVPPLPGFSGRWRIYLALYTANPALMALFLLASGLALLAYIRALTNFWWSGEDQIKDAPTEKLPLIGVLTVLSIVLLISGFFPEVFPMFTSWMGGLI